MDAVQRLLVEELTAKSGIEVIFGQRAMVLEFGTLAFGCGGAYRKGNDVRPPLLFWAPELDTKRATHVLFHEAAHATGVLLGRNMTTDLFTIEYEREEVIAESVAKMLMDRFGFSTDYTREQTEKYLERYNLCLAQIDKEYAASQIQKTYEFLLKNWLHDFEARLSDLRKVS